VGSIPIHSRFLDRLAACIFQKNRTQMGRSQDLMVSMGIVMGASPLRVVVRHLRRIARPGRVAPSSDAELLARFAGLHDELAFAEIVQRHGPLVWAVCRSGLSAADADDAFQATFLVLTQKATRIRKREALAGWLAGVARRVVRRIRTKDARRSDAEQRLAARPRPIDDSDALVRDEWRQMLNEELHRLPEKYLLPMLLCYYQGLTNEEAARRLGLPHGTVCGRLSRARELLRRRLTRRGVTLTVGMLTVGVTAPPAEVLSATLATCGSVTIAGANITAPALTIAEAVMNSMWVEKVRTWAVGLMVVTAVGGGIGGYGIGPATGDGGRPVIGAAKAAEPPPPNAAPPGKIEEIEKAGMAFLNGKTDEAFKLLQDAVKKHPELPPARLMLARLYRAAQRVPDVDKQFRAILEQAVIENPDHPVVYLELAKIAVSEGRNTEAILDCLKAQDLAAPLAWTDEQRMDVNFAARGTIANAYEARGDWLRARVQIEVLMAITPKDGALRRRYSRALLALGKPDQAYREMVQAVNDSPEIGPSELCMATESAAIGDAAITKSWFEKAVKVQPKSGRVHLAFGEWLAGQKDWIGAKKHADLAAELLPGNKSVIRLQAQITDGEKPNQGPEPRK
jgi:RNA polymerase sigma factor (sigma-70 family)